MSTLSKMACMWFLITVELILIFIQPLNYIFYNEKKSLSKLDIQKIVKIIYLLKLKFEKFF